MAMVGLASLDILSSLGGRDGTDRAHGVVAIRRLRLPAMSSSKETAMTVLSSLARAAEGPVAPCPALKGAISHVAEA